MNTTCKKRLQREINYIKEKMSEYTILDEMQENESKREIYLHIITPSQNELVFTLPYDFPFKPPQNLSVNGQNYRYLLKNMPTRIYYLYYHPDEIYFKEKSVNINYNNTNCLCCSSLLCADNWSPVNMVYHILNEIKQHNELKRIIMYKLMLKNMFDYFELPLELMRNIYDFL